RRMVGNHASISLRSQERSWSLEKPVPSPPWSFLLERHHDELRDHVSLELDIGFKFTRRHAVDILPDAVIGECRHRLEEHRPLDALDDIDDGASVETQGRRSPERRGGYGE